MKKFIGAVLCLAVLLTNSPCPVTAAEEVAPGTLPVIPTEGDVWDGTTNMPTKLVMKDGVAYYEISTCEELAYVAQEAGDWLTYNYVLNNDLILNNIVITWDEEGKCTNDAECLNTWLPIGAETPFSGTFDGAGHVISGVYINGDPNLSGEAGLFGYASGGISNLKVVNSYILSAAEYTGGIVGCCYNVRDCTFCGAVIGNGKNTRTGGIAGLGAGNNSINYGTVFGKDYVGGIVGMQGFTLDRCANYGAIIGERYVGGIAGHRNGAPTRSINYGYIRGKEYVGGIIGSGCADRCSNYGAVEGAQYIGGVVGNGEWIYNSSNAGAIVGDKYVGGIAGFCDYEIANCYNIGKIVHMASNENDYMGAITGSDEFVWGRATARDCYFLQSPEESLLFGCGNVITTTKTNPSGFYARTNRELRVRETFEGWRFEPYQGEWHPDPDTGEYTYDYPPLWAIDVDANGGYPYLLNLLAGDALYDVPVSSVGIKKEAMLSVGDVEHFIAYISPTNATNTNCTWVSSDSAVASVTENGRVEAKKPGTATITVTTEDGSRSASCTVTVTGRTSNDYRLGALILRDGAGTTLDVIPAGDFWVTVPITKLAETGNANILLAAYDDGGKFLQMFHADVSRLPQSAAIDVGFYIKNAGNVAKVKAFAISSLADLTPLATAVEVGR